MAANVQLRPDTNYNMLVAVNGLVVTVTVNNSQSFSYAFAPRLIDGVPSNLNWGYVGFGSQNAKGKLDNVQVKVLERPFTLITTETFDDGAADLFTGAQAGEWQIQSGRYLGAGADPAMSLVDLGLEKGIQANARTELSVTLSTAATAGFVFDLYSADDFKFVLADTVADRIFIGHRARGAWTIDASAAFVLNADQDHRLLISLAASTVSVMVDDKAVVGHAYNAVVVDGAFGTMARGGGASFDDFTLKTSDSRFKEPVAEMLIAAAAASTAAPSDGYVTEAQLVPFVAEAIARWSQALGADIGSLLDGVVFAVGDLEGLALAQTIGKVVVIDVNGAGHGWFIDPTPSDDKEFPNHSGDELAAPSSGAAYGRIDLLTVVMHEIGHVLGFDHDGAAGGALMQESLAASVRRLPEAGAVAPEGTMSVADGSDTEKVSFSSSAAGPESATAGDTDGIGSGTVSGAGSTGGVEVTDGFQAAASTAETANQPSPDSDDSAPPPAAQESTSPASGPASTEDAGTPDTASATSSTADSGTGDQAVTGSETTASQPPAAAPGANGQGRRARS
jgi:hypothetical protein